VNYPMQLPGSALQCCWGLAVAAHSLDQAPQGACSGTPRAASQHMGHTSPARPPRTIVRFSGSLSACTALHVW
jgi:hypothetical protein